MNAVKKTILFICVIVFYLIMAGCQKKDEGFMESEQLLNYENIDIPSAGDTYKNPIDVPDSWGAYGIGDPYILKYDGLYYLYASTKDHFIGIRGWFSENLIDWEYIGVVADEPLTIGAYAPEVIYYNGIFYMITSPGGNGHYILTSESPLGPFKTVTDNFGKSIDGSFFIDDDNAWYMTHAGTSIQIAEVKEDLDIRYSKDLNLSLGGWTEGSMIIKRLGVYYITYTGNHLDSRGYRVNYAVSTESPLGPYIIKDNNPIIINTEGDLTGLGHSATVQGPDLDSYYIVYHNSDYSNGYRERFMNINRLFFNGHKMTVNGSAEAVQPVPQLPDFWIREDEIESKYNEMTLNNHTCIISNSTSDADYTAVFNFSDANESEDFGIIFNFIDLNNYSYIDFDKENNCGLFGEIVNGEKKELGSFELYENFKWDVLHTLRIEKNNENIFIYIDGLKRMESTSSLSTGGKTGYYWGGTSPKIGYTAFSNQVHGSSDNVALKLIPGEFDAIHYYPVETLYEHKIVANEDGSNAIVLDEANEWLSYNVMVEKSGDYHVAISYEADNNAELELYIDNELANKIFLDAAEENGAIIKKVSHVYFYEGCHVITLRLLSDAVVKLNSYEFSNVSLENIDLSYSLTDSKIREFTYVGEIQSWRATTDGYVVRGADEKVLIGSTDWYDYEVSVQLLRNEDDLLVNSGLLLRSSNESYYPHQTQDALIGYFVKVTNNKISLYKMNYDRVLLQTARIEFEPNISYDLKAILKEGNIQVFWNGESEAIIDYYDNNPILTGRIGLWSMDSNIAYKNIIIRSLDESEE